MFQNHMLQLLSLIAMEPQSLFEAERVRDEKNKVFRSLRPISDPGSPENFILGQYATAEMDGKRVAGYREEPGVRPYSFTPTFAALKVYIDNWRWQGVPFYLRTGKRLPKRLSEVVLAFREAPSAADPMKVEVVNTSIVSVVSAAGQFELTNVPAGQVRLRFFGAGADASVSISEVKAGETVTISVTVVGTSAALESERHSSASEEQVEINGIVENLTGSALAFQFFVSGRLIKGDSQTEFFGNGHRDTFADLSSQDRVEVKGQQRDGYVYAVRLHINDGNDDADDDDVADNDDDADEVELKGAVTGASGTCPGVVTFTLQGKTVMTSLSTILGILPIAMALGAGAESRRSMGIAVVGGLIVGTLLTLVAIPAMYTYLTSKNRVPRSHE